MVNRLTDVTEEAQDGGSKSDGKAAPDRRPFLGDESRILNYVSLDSIKDLDDTINFLRYVLPNIGEASNITSAYDDNNQDVSEFSGFFLNERKYFVGDFVRFKFRFSKENEVFDTIQKRLVKKYQNRMCKNENEEEVPCIQFD